MNARLLSSSWVYMASHCLLQLLGGIGNKLIFILLLIFFLFLKVEVNNQDKV